MLFHSTSRRWKLLKVFCDRRGVWHCAELSPHSWQLDPTEGPSRQRCRLSRCHLKLDKRFFLPEQQCSHGKKISNEAISLAALFVLNLLTSFGVHPSNYSLDGIYQQMALGTSFRCLSCFMTINLGSTQPLWSINCIRVKILSKH